MYKRVLIGVCLLILGLTGGCATVRVWSSLPAAKTLENDHFSASFEPLRKEDQRYFSSFLVTLHNKTDQPIIIDWEKSRYLYNGRTSGLFLSEETTAKNVNNPPSDTVAPGATLSKRIAPVTLLGYQRVVSAQKPSEETFSAGVVPEGENGIHLVVRSKEKEIAERITVTIHLEQNRP